MMKISIAILGFFADHICLGSTSAENRKTKAIAVEAATGHIYGKLSGGAHLVYFFQPNMTFDLNYTTSKADYRADYGDETRFIGLGVRQFFGNSFNVRGGLGYLQASRNVTYWRGGSRETGLVNIENNELVGEVTLGNQWCYDNGMTLGVDWLGYFGSFAKMGSRISMVNDVGQLTKNLKNGIEDQGHDSAVDDPLQLRLTWGYQF